MTKKLFSLILLAPLLAFGCAGVSAASEHDCLSYEPAIVTLSGRVSLKVFPGRPNYESIKEGDEPEPAWILHLTKPICVKADGRDEFNVAVEDVSDIHLVMRGKQFSQLKRARKKGATGRLFHAFTAHHHAEVLMSVTRINSQ